MESKTLPEDNESNSEELQMSKKSYVERSLEWLRKEGVVYSVASWYGIDRKRHDLMGVFDYVAFFPGHNREQTVKLTGVQICGQDFQPHVRKIECSFLARLWIESGNDIFLIGWRELKKGWQPRFQNWSRGDLTKFHANPSIPSKKLKTPDIELL